MNRFFLLLIAAIIIIGGIVLSNNKGFKNTTEVKQTVTQPVTSIQPTNANSKETTIMVTSSGFEPQALKIKAGIRVVWINKSSGLATINSAVHPTHLVYPPLNLGEFGNGSSVQLVFDKPGIYKYHNHLNPGQTGEIVVE